MCCVPVGTPRVAVVEGDVLDQDTRRLPSTSAFEVNVSIAHLVWHGTLRWASVESQNCKIFCCSASCNNNQGGFFGCGMASSFSGAKPERNMKSVQE